MAYEDVKTPIPDYEHLFTEEAYEKRGGGGGMLKKLAKENKWGLILSSVLFAIKHCPIWIIPIITANIIDVVSTGADVKNIFINLGILLVLLLQNIPTHILYAKYLDRVLRTTGAGLRNTLIKKLMHLSITYHKEMESGRIQAKFLRDIEAIEFLNTHIMKSVMPAILSIIVATSVTLYKNPGVAAFFVFVIPCNILLINFFRGTMRKSNKEFRKENEDISARVSGMINMIPVTKAHGLENEEIAALEKNIENLRRKGLILDRTNAYFGSYAWVISETIKGICLLFTSLMAINGKISVGDIVVFQTYFSTISNAVQSLVGIYPELAKGLESIRSVSEIFLSENIEDDTGKIRLRYVHGTVQFENVSYRYKDAAEDAIKDFSLDVQPGECVAFVGASGSGKSTLMNMIIGFLQPTKGVIKIDGKPIDALSLSDYRHFISVVPQNSILFPGSICDNITYGLHDVDKKRLDEVIEIANIKEFVDDLPNGLDTLIGEHGDKLSGGQKQRISIARALIRDPKILILDEATSALDNISEYHVQKAMSHLIKDRTTFIVAHRLSTIRDADRIVVLENSRCVETGTYDELMAKKGKFYELKTLNDIESHKIEEL